MSIHGISGGAGYLGIRPGEGQGGVRAPEEGVRRPVEEGGAARTSGVEGGALARVASESSAVTSAEAPAGTDPALWSVLTSEERAYYARMQEMGPLTYGPSQGGGPAETVARGGRIDVRA